MLCVCGVVLGLLRVMLALHQSSRDRKNLLCQVLSGDPTACLPAHPVLQHAQVPLWVSIDYVLSCGPGLIAGHPRWQLRAAGEEGQEGQGQGVPGDDCWHPQLPRVAAGHGVCLLLWC